MAHYDFDYPYFSATDIANVTKYSNSDAAFPTGDGSMSSTRTNIKFNILKMSCPSERLGVTINISNIPTNDIKPLSVTAPISQCYLGNDSVKVRIKNMLPNTVPAGTQVYCQVNGKHNTTRCFKSNQ